MATQMEATPFMRRNPRRRKDDPRYISPIQTIIDELESRAGGNSLALAHEFEKKIEATDDVGACALLRSELREQYRELGDHDAEERMLLEDCDREPKSPVFWSALANFYWSQQCDYRKARRAAVKAIRVAEEHDCLVVNSCNSLANIACDAQDYGTLSECLEAIMAYAPSPGARDTNYERNFLRRLPVGAIEAGLRTRYGMFLRKSGHLRDYRPHKAIERFRPVVMLIQERGANALTEELLERAEAARHLLRDMRGVPGKIIDAEDILVLGRVISDQLMSIKDIVKSIEDDRLAFSMDEAAKRALEKLKVVTGRYFRRHGRAELKRYISSMRAGEFDDL